MTAGILPPADCPGASTPWSFPRTRQSGRTHPLTSVILTKAGVAKSLKALNHEGHEGHQGKEKLFFVLFVVTFFSGSFASPSAVSSSNG